MKIAIIGTHGVGKTTLVLDVISALKKKDYDAEFVKEVARKCPLEINEKSSIDTELWIMCNQISEETVMNTNYKMVICDRSVLDTLCYGIYAYGENQLLSDMVNQWMPTYDLVFRTPILKRYPLPYDRFRSRNKKFQKKIDQIIEQELKKREVPYIELPKKRSKEKFVLDVIYKHMRNNGKNNK